MGTSGGTRRKAARYRGAVLVIGALGAVVAASVAGDRPAGAQAPPPPEFVLSPEGNHLWAYDTATGQHQLLAQAVNGTDPGATAPNGLRRDINGQICVSPDQRHVITGEDTVLADAAGGDGGSSHDPRIAGWGFFEIHGSSLGSLAMEQVGKLAPEAGRGPGYAGDPDNYGCGFLDSSRLFTTAIGNTLPGEPSNGQLFLWFGPFDTGFQEVHDDSAGVRFFVGEVDHCEIDVGLATAGGVAVSPDGSVYVATNRPGDDGRPAGVVRYAGTWPHSFDECTPEFLAANITRTQILPAVADLPADPHAPTPSAVVVSPAGTLYVSSVFSGTVAEFRTDGTWVRDLWPLSPATPPQGPFGQTPFGLVLSGDGSLWIADLGIVLAQPGPGEGSLVRVRFDEAGNPAPLGETVRDGLTFPDGLGVYRPAIPAPDPTLPAADVAVQAAAAAGSPSPGGRLPATGGEAVPVVAALLLAAGLVLGRVR